MDEEEDEDDDELLLAAPAVVYTPSSDPLGEPGDGFDEDPREDDDRGAAYGAAAVGAGAGVAAAAAASGRGAAAGASGRGAAAAADSFDPDAISFGGSADDISFGSAASLIQVDDPPEDPVGGDDDFLDVAPTPVPAARRPAPRERKPERQRQPIRPRQTQSSSSDGGFEVGASLGYARFQVMNFLTYGIEASYGVTSNLAIVGGFDAYTTKRTLPPEEVEEGQPASTWNTLLPLHFGAVYRPTGSTLEPKEFRPYIGGGIQLIPGYVKEGGGMAFGMRAVGGADYALTDRFAMRLAIGTGFWTGEYWYLIDELERNFGFIFQTNIGAVMAF